MAAEENYLRSKFGAEYEDYCRRVNRWIPDFRGFGETLASMEFNWRRVIVKEYSSVYSWIVVAILIETVKTLRAGASAEHLRALGFIFAAATIVFLAVYVLKKTRLIADRPL